MTYWRWKAPVYSHARRLPGFRHILAAEQRNISQLLQQYPPANGFHLDLGSGDSLLVLPDQSQRIAVDAEFSMLARNPTPYRVVARAEALPFPAASVSFISAIGLLEYLEEPEKFLPEVRRVLQPAGYFLFTSSPPNWANRMRLVWGEKLHFYSERRLREVLKAHNWKVLGHRQSWLQEQWLVYCEASPI